VEWAAHSPIGLITNPAPSSARAIGLAEDRRGWLIVFFCQMSCFFLLEAKSKRKLSSTDDIAVRTVNGTKHYLSQTMTKLIDKEL
jgi:hypothetical protein